jgi:hypothetical protein
MTTYVILKQLGSKLMLAPSRYERAECLPIAACNFDVNLLARLREKAAKGLRHEVMALTFYTSKAQVTLGVLEPNRPRRNKVSSCTVRATN